MFSEVRFAALVTAAALLLGQPAAATSFPRISFEELTDNSDVIATGSVVRSWSSWDSTHKYIWTHYEIAVNAAWKGGTATTLQISEPGGVVDGVGMTIGGAVAYKPGESVVVFAQQMPNGYLRTTGWGQGKFSVDASGMLRADTALLTAELTASKDAASGTPLQTLTGMSLGQLTARVSARIRLVQAKTQGKVQ